VPFTADNFRQKHNQGYRTPIQHWYNKVKEAGFHSVNVIAATFHEHYKDILNFYNKHLLNQPMQKSKSLERTPWGIDKKFFLFRIANLEVFHTKFLLPHPAY
jgi:transposase